MGFILTKEQFAKARAYIPLAEKTAFVETNAPKCFDRLQISAGNDSMPPMYMENAALRSRYLMYALLALYLKIDGVEHEDMLLTEAEYDKHAGSHIINQIERFKAFPELRDKAFDLLFDYRDLCKRFGEQIHGLLAVQNDSVLRQSMATKAEMAELPALLEELKKLSADGGGDRK